VECGDTLAPARECHSALEQSLDLWERGEKLAAICAEWLDGARARLTAAMAAREPADGPASQDAPF